MANEYTETWFAAFLDAVPGDQTAVELALLERWLPLPAFRRVLDLCCGAGRHARGLAAAGREVVGVDRSDAALERARDAAGPRVRLVRGDAYRLGEIEAELGGPFDAAVCLWQSFGHGSEEANRDLLADLAGRLRPGGRLVLDLYHRGWLASQPAERVLERAVGGRTLRVVARQELRGRRLAVRLDYGEGRAPDVFDWEVFTPDELAEAAAPAGLAPVRACARWREGLRAGPADARMQLLLERRP